MITTRRIAVSLAVPAVSLAVIACGGGGHQAASTDQPASAGGTSLSAQAGGSGVSVGEGSAVRSANPSATATVQPIKHREPTVRLAPKAQRRFYREGANPQVAVKVPAKHSTGASARLTKPQPRHVGRGTYVGPAHNGLSKCGYVAIGAGMEQAAAFHVHGVACDTARKLAVAANGHTSAGKMRYSALGYACTGSVPGSKALVTFECTQGSKSVRFQLT
jgi:hypothetical protein